MADFVGSDRALKSLSLTRLEDVELVIPPTVSIGEPVERVRERIASGDLVPIDAQVLVVDGGARPLDWLAVARLDEGNVVPTRPSGGAEPVLDQVTTLRDALSALLEANAAYGVVVDGAGAALGLLGIGEVASVFRPVGAAG